MGDMGYITDEADYESPKWNESHLKGEFGEKLPNGATIIQASARNANEWILLCHAGGAQPFVTWRSSRPGDGSDTTHGHYFSDLMGAVADFHSRG